METIGLMGIIQGLYSGYIGIMKKKTETIGPIWGLFRGLIGDVLG